MSLLRACFFVLRYGVSELRARRGAAGLSDPLTPPVCSSGRICISMRRAAVALLFTLAAVPPGAVLVVIFTAVVKGLGTYLLARTFAVIQVL